MVLLVFLRGLKRLALSKVGSLRRLSLLPPRSLRSLRSRSGEVEGGDAKDRRGLMERLEVVMLRKVFRRCPAGDKNSSSSNSVVTA